MVAFSFINIKKPDKSVKSKRFNNNGFALDEMIIVIAIISILAGIAIPRLRGFRQLAEKRVCEANRMTVLGQYEAFSIGKHKI